MTTSAQYLTVEISGTHREIGMAVGEAAREQIRAAVDWYAESLPALAAIDFSEARGRARVYLDHARRHLPECFEELVGMSEGAGVPLDALAVPNCGEELTCGVDGVDPCLPARAAPACTSVALFAGDRHIVGHNMDWYAVDLDKNVLFDVTPPSGVRFLTLCGVPYLPALGFNSAGICYLGNAMFGNDERMGVPNVMVRRWALEARSIGEGCRRAEHPQRARGSNHLFASVDGQLANLETSATAAALIEDADLFAHTNHYVHDDMLLFEGSAEVNSRDRLRRAEALLAEGARNGEDPLHVVMRVLSDHAHAPGAICRHPEHLGSAQDELTVGSMVCDLDSGRLYVCSGPPCSGEYTSYVL